MHSPGAIGTRAALLAALAFGTVGCADPETQFFPQDSRFADATCRAVANDRANDALTLVDSPDEQQQVFQLTYTGCVDWQRTH